MKKKSFSVIALALLGAALIWIVALRAEIEAAEPWTEPQAEELAAELIAAPSLETARNDIEDLSGSTEPRDYYPEIPLSEELQKDFFNACRRYGILPELGLALIETESGFDTEALSCCGCYGLCQLHPVYFGYLSVPEQIYAGMEYLARCIDANGGVVNAGLTAYNAGHDTGDRTYANAVTAKIDHWKAVLG